MKPNFALNLSHEGISLLHRAKTGWSRVGDVALDDPDLNEHLSLMRKTAADLDSGGLTSKLVIPNSQILYTEVEAPGPDTAARIAQIRDGLVGLTPYDVKDLVFDWRMKGTRAQVAVVARETLQEAEAFAAEFRFNPVSYVAVPVNGGFDGEPFFGPTQHAATLLGDGEKIEPDDERMQVLRAPAAPKPEPKPASVAAPIIEPIPEEPAPVKPPPAKAKKAKAPPKPAEKPEPELAPMPVTFASRRAAPPPEPVVAFKASQPPKTTAPEPKPEPPEVTFSHQASALDLDDVPDMPAWRTVNGRDVTPLAMTAAHTADTPPPSEPKSQKVAAVASAALTGTIGTLGKLGQGTAAGMRRIKERKPAAPPPVNTEAQTMTVFGARAGNKVGGKPRYLGLMLTVLLLIALGILALWASFFPGDDTTAGFSDATETPQIAATSPDAPEIATPAPATSETPAPESPELSNSIDAAVEAALLDTLPPDPDAAASEQPDDGNVDLALLSDPTAPSVPDTPPPDRITQPPPTRAEAEASYAATGIWLLDPEPLPGQTGGDRLEGLFIASIDPKIGSQDAVALPDSATLTDDLRPAALQPPAALGTSYDLDERGLVRATPEGAISPEGVRVFAGTPPYVPPPRPGSVVATDPVTPTPETAETAETTPAVTPLDPERERLRQIRPRIRPETLQETNERSRLGGFSRSELALIRPTLRPASIQEEVAAEAAAAATAANEEPPVESTSESAIVASLSPTLRPANFSRTVEKALEEALKNPPAPATNPAPAPNVAAAVVPSIPSRASVAKQATERNAINLSKVNLIGIYGSPSDRRALVRLRNGRYVKVEIGDRVDGGRVAAIGDNELRYVKGGRNITLKMPKG